MPRRSWRDLDDQQPRHRPGGPAAAAPNAPAGGPRDLEQAAAMAPDSRLNTLLQERRVLEDRLRNLTGLPGQESGDAHRDARFRVPTFAERQAEIRAWEDQRARQFNPTNTENAARWGSNIGQPRRPPPPRPGDPAQVPATGLGASGLSDRMRALRSGISDRSRSAREGLLEHPRDAANRLHDAGRPLRQIGDQLRDQDRQLDEMDRKLAAEGVSEAERAEIREAVEVDGMKKTSALMDKANKAISAPKEAVDKVESGWLRREQQITGPMDRFSGYADQRERRLSTETGGSGNLFERMQANRMSALRRRREQQLQDRRDERRRERANERAAERRAEEDRTAR